MAKIFFPFDAGPGYDVSESEWALMARLWRATGVAADELDRLAVSADGADMTVDVATGVAWVRGFYFRSDAVETLTIAAADPFDPRIDRVVVRLDRDANTVDLDVLTGAPAADPSAPALTQTDVVWEIELAQVTVPANASAIAAGNVDDTRSIVSNPPHDGATAPTDGHVPTYRGGVLTPEPIPSPTLVYEHGCHVANNQNQAVPSGTATQAALQVAEWVRGGTFDNGTGEYVVAVAGLYVVSWHLQVNSNSADEKRSYVFVNGSGVLYGWRHYQSGNGHAGDTVAVIDAAVGDRIGGGAYFAGGTVRDIANGCELYVALAKEAA